MHHGSKFPISLILNSKDKIWPIVVYRSLMLYHQYTNKLCEMWCDRWPNFSFNHWVLSGVCWQSQLNLLWILLVFTIIMKIYDWKWHWKFRPTLKQHRTLVAKCYTGKSCWIQVIISSLQHIFPVDFNAIFFILKVTKTVTIPAIFLPTHHIGTPLPFCYISRPFKLTSIALYSIHEMYKWQQ